MLEIYKDGLKCGFTYSSKPILVVTALRIVLIKTTQELHVFIVLGATWRQPLLHPLKLRPNVVRTC